MQMLAQRTGATLRHVGLTPDQRIDVEVPAFPQTFGLYNPPPSPPLPLPPLGATVDGWID